MLNILLPSATVLVLVGIVNFIYQSNLSKTKLRRALSAIRTLSPAEILQAVKDYGGNSNSFMTLYPGFQYFASRNPNTPGIIAFLDLSHAWIGGTEPIADSKHQAALLTEFAETAAVAGKCAILIPVSSRLTEKATSVGYDSIMIGSEPTFDLERYPKTGSTWLGVVPTAKALESKGGRVVEVQSPIESQPLKEELESITQEWLASRKMDPLGFLNKVEPWTLSEHKRYFYLEQGGKILAFLAAIPIWPRKGWYLIDLVRRNEAPTGTTELLTLQAMRLLRETGAQEITFGVSPLSLLDQVNSYPLAQSEKHSFLYPLLRYLYEKGGFYNFKSLFQYKVKFAPSSIEPSFLIYKNALRSTQGQKQKMTLREVINVFQAFSQRGITRATLSGIRRGINQLSIPDLIKNQLKISIVVRSVPKDWRRLAYRCKFTFVMIVINLLVYFLTTDRDGHIISSIEANWGYTWNSLFQSPVHALLLSPFLHWNLLHLNFNMTCLFFFTGGLEYLAGTRITAACYVVSMLFSNPLTSLLLMRLSLTNPSEIDVGASLGIFGCGGALSWFFLKNRWLLIIPLCFVTLLQSWDTQHWIIMNHWSAVLIGILVGRLILRK